MGENPISESVVATRFFQICGEICTGTGSIFPYILNGRKSNFQIRVCHLSRSNLWGYILRIRVHFPIHFEWEKIQFPDQGVPPDSFKSVGKYAPEQGPFSHTF